MKDEALEGKPFNYGVMLAVIPLLLAISVAIALYLGANEEQEERTPVEGEVTVAEMEDYLNKLTHLIGLRDIKTKAGQKNLRAAAAMIDGTLGPMNVGYDIFQKMDPAEGLLWRTIWIEAGDREAKDVVIIAVPYGNEGDEVAYALGLGEYFTKDRPDMKVKLVFYPPLEEFTWSWLRQQVINEGEVCAGVLSIRILGEDTKWATLTFAQESPMVERITKTVSERQWLQYLNLPIAHDAQTEEVALGLHRDPRSPSGGTAARFLRMLPVVKLIADRMVK